MSLQEVIIIKKKKIYFTFRNPRPKQRFTMSLKENLENFLEHYENMTDLSSSLDGSDSFDLEFTHLKQISQRYRTDKVYPTSAGESDVNMRKNRYKDILPFDHSRFILSQIDNQEGSDYINANYLKGIGSDRSYLAAQGPLPHTVNDFWRMLWESNTEVIIMACNEFEQGRHKCERYWVDEGEEHAFGDILVTQIRQQRVTKDFMIRTLKATKDKEEKIFNQFHYTAWPDHGVPTSVKPILDMIKLVREYQKVEDPPIVVHCSAGCGRTGTICVIDYVRNALQLEKIDQNFSLYDIIVEMRKQRHAIVQTKNQYELVHRAVVNMFQSHLGIKPEDFGHNYENVQLKHEFFEKPRMPPKVPGQSGAGEKRDSSSHNYVNCNITSKGVSMDPPEPPMPKLPSGPAKSSRGSDSPDSSLYANCDVGATSGDSGKPAQDVSPPGSNKQASQTPQAKSRPSPDDRYKNNFKATLSAFQDIELDVMEAHSSTSSAPTPPSPQPVAQTRPKPAQAVKPVAHAKPQIAGKPKTKPSPPVKPSSVDVNVKQVCEKLGNGEFVPMAKPVATRQNSNPVTRSTPKDMSSVVTKNNEKKEALKLPVKPMRHLEKCKSEGDGALSPGVRQGAIKPVFKGNVKGDRPSQPPPKPPASTKPPFQRSNGEDRTSVKGRHDYEEVHISPPSGKGKETSESVNSKNFRSSPTQQMDSFDTKESGIVRRKTDTSRKLSSGSVQSVGSDSKSLRKNSEEYAYVQQPTSMLDKLLKSEEGAPSSKPNSTMYSEAYSEVSGAPLKPGQRLSASSKDYSYVDTSKIVAPEKPKRGESISGGDRDSDYDLVGIPSHDGTFDSLLDTESTYSPAGESIDDMDSDIPKVPVRTAQSYQLVDDDEKEEKASGGGKMNKVKAKLANSRDLIGEKQGKIVNNTRGLFKRIGEALKPETHSAPSPESDSAKPSNINDLLEKTLQDYKPAYKEGPVGYKDQDIGFPKRVANPRRPRSPPSSWGVRSAQVHL